MEQGSSVIRRPNDLALGLLFVVWAAGLGYQSLSYAIGTSREMGPGYLPLMLAYCLGGLGAILIVQSFFGARTPAARILSRPLVVILTATTLFALLLRPAGAIVAIPALVITASFAHPEHRLGQATVFAVALAGGCIVLFSYLLGQQIPLRGYWFGH